MPKKLKKPEKVLVIWLDAQDLPEHWIRSGEHHQDAALVETVGWLIKPDPLKGHITVACSWHDGAYGAGINIPKVCVTKMRTLR
jgi:hypothetical protein